MNSLAQPLHTDAANADTLPRNAKDSEVHDVVGELANMIGGALKSLLCDADLFCAISASSVIQGAFALEASPGRENVAYIAKLDVRDYFVKPFQDAQLIEKVQHVISLQPNPALWPLDGGCGESAPSQRD